MSALPFDLELDTSGLCCPMPLLKAKQALHRLEPGQVLKVIATDGGSRRDFPAYVEVSDHELLQMFSDGQYHLFWIRRGAAA